MESSSGLSWQWLLANSLRAIPERDAGAWVRETRLGALSARPAELCTAFQSPVPGWTVCPESFPGPRGPVTCALPCWRGEG